MQLNITAQLQQKAQEAINLEKQGKKAEAEKIKAALLSELVNGGGSQSAFTKSKWDPQAVHNSDLSNITPDEAIRAAKALKALQERGVDTRNHTTQDLLVEAFLDDVFGPDGVIGSRSASSSHSSDDKELDAVIDKLYGPK